MQISGGAKHADVGDAKAVRPDLDTLCNKHDNAPLLLLAGEERADESLRPAVLVFPDVTLQNLAVHIIAIRPVARLEVLRHRDLRGGRHVPSVVLCGARTHACRVRDSSRQLPRQRTGRLPIGRRLPACPTSARKNYSCRSARDTSRAANGPIANRPQAASLHHSFTGGGARPWDRCARRGWRAGHLR